MKIRFTYCLNDAADLLVRIRLSSELANIKKKQAKDRAELLEDSDLQDEDNVDEMVQFSFFYYSAGIKNSQQGEYLFYDGLKKNMKELVGVSMNERFIFFWNLGSAWKLDLVSKEITKLSLYISE